MRLEWDKVGERFYETGVDRGVLYIPSNGVYSDGVPWNGLTTVTESPSGAESSAQYADNIKYLNLVSAEEFGATIEAFTYPPEFAQFDGSAVLHGGVAVGQQNRKAFGLSYRSRVGNDVDGADLGYKLHLIYGAQAAPSERAYTTVNDSPEAMTLSWELSTTAVAVGTIDGVTYKPTAFLTIDSTKVTAANLTALEDAIWGTSGTDPRLPLPAEVIGMFAGALTTVNPMSTPPTYNTTTAGAADTVTLPAATGIVWYLNDVVTAAGTYTVPLNDYAVVRAVPATGYVFSKPTQDTWVFGPSA